ncbi:MAG: TRAP transporter small permease [Rhodobacteraceae bacterium]|nr:TRAP transporter small permease [Paracoccaceae bacterium]
MAQLDKIARGLNAGSAVIAALLLVYILGHILLEICFRAFFSSSTYVLDEFVGYAVAAMTFFALGPALQAGSLIRVNVIVSRLEAEARRQVEMAGVVATCGMTLFAGFWVGRDAWRSFLRGSVSESVAEVPLWLPLGAVWLGLMLFGFQLAVYFLRLSHGGAVIGGEEAEIVEPTAAAPPVKG